MFEMLNDSRTYEEITANKDKNVMKLIKELAGSHSHSLTENIYIYLEITANKDKNVMKLIKELAGSHSHSLTEKGVNYLCHFDFKTSGFYGLPKIHKSKIICQEAEVQKNHTSEFLGQQISNSGR